MTLISNYNWHVSTKARVSQGRGSWCLPARRHSPPPPTRPPNPCECTPRLVPPRVSTSDLSHSTSTLSCILYLWVRRSMNCIGHFALTGLTGIMLRYGEWAPITPHLPPSAFRPLFLSSPPFAVSILRDTPQSIDSVTRPCVPFDSQLPKLYFMSEKHITLSYKEGHSG